MPSNLVLIDNRIKQHQVLVDALNDHSVGVVIDYAKDSIARVEAAIGSSGTEFDSIAYAAHQTRFSLFQLVQSTNQTNTTAFFRRLLHRSKARYLDFLGCALPDVKKHYFKTNSNSNELTNILSDHIYIYEVKEYIENSENGTVSSITTFSDGGAISIVNDCIGFSVEFDRVISYYARQDIKQDINQDSIYLKNGNVYLQETSTTPVQPVDDLFKVTFLDEKLNKFKNDNNVDIYTYYYAGNLPTNLYNVQRTGTTIPSYYKVTTINDSQQEFFKYGTGEGVQAVYYYIEPNEILNQDSLPTPMQYEDFIPADVGKVLVIYDFQRDNSLFYKISNTGNITINQKGEVMQNTNEPLDLYEYMVQLMIDGKLKMGILNENMTIDKSHYENAKNAPLLAFLKMSEMDGLKSEDVFKHIEDTTKDIFIELTENGPTFSQTMDYASISIINQNTQTPSGQWNLMVAIPDPNTDVVFTGTKYKTAENTGKYQIVWRKK